MKPVLPLLCALTVLVTNSFASPPPDKPNFIVLLTDDQGWADTSRPADPTIPDSFRTFFHTPNMARLSESGMNFTSGHLKNINAEVPGVKKWADSE
jgi:hypothetical protein